MSAAERKEAEGSGAGDSPARRRRRCWLDIGLYSVLKLLSQIAAIVLFDVRVHNLDRLPRRRNFVLAPNHASFLDPWLVGLGTPTVLHFLARDSLFRIPLLGWLLRHLNAREVKRETAAARQGIQASVEALNQGGSLVLFPEGTRSPDGRLGTIKRGITLVLRRTDCPVVPVYVDGTFAIWPKGQSAPLTGSVRLVYGDPLWLRGTPDGAGRASPRAEGVELPGDSNEKSSGDLQTLVEDGWAQDSAKAPPEGPAGPAGRTEPESPYTRRQLSSATFLEALGQSYRALHAEARLRRWYRESPRRNSESPPESAPAVSR